MSPRTVLITGASRGIGRAIALKFSHEGYHLLTPSHAELDLSSNISIDRYVKNLQTKVDILINNAGINRLAAGEECTDEDLDDTLQINLVAPARLARAVIPWMVQQKFGRIINISSIWGVVSKPRRFAYTISKTGINGLTRALAVELGPHNILVNSVVPGYVNTELTQKNNSLQDIQKISDQIPLGRLAEPAEIANLVSFLCSDKNSYITGQMIVIDGGFTCQ